MNQKINNNTQAGAVDEKVFLISFENVPSVQIYSGKDVKDFIKKFSQTIENEREDWSKRVDCIKKIRSLIKAGALCYEDFFVSLNSLLPPFHAALKDLRSHVVRESCVTIAYLSKNLASKFDFCAESLLNYLINLIQNSAKVISSSGAVCIRFILQYTHAPRLIPIIVNNLSSKNTNIRKACYEFINIILQTWHIHLIEKNLPKIQEAIKKGISDADQDARAYARNARDNFIKHFPESAESFENSCDYSYRKLLPISTPNFNAGSKLRSNSAIDLQAARRAKSRARKVTPTPEQRVSRTKSRISVSTPNSRSGSPSSRLNYSGSPSPSSKFNYSNCQVDTLCSSNNISEIIKKCDNDDWNKRKEGLINLQYYIQEDNKLTLIDLTKIMDIFIRMFNDPRVKVFSLFMDTLNELILSHSEDLCFCLHLLLTRLFNKLGMDLLNSDIAKVKKTLDNVFQSFPADIQLNSVFRFLVDPTQTPNTKVKLAVMNYIIRLTSKVDSCIVFNSSINGTSKDYVTMALNKMINWAMSDNIKSSPELRKFSQKAIFALFNLNPLQITQRLSTMPKEYQETASEICRFYNQNVLKSCLDELPQRGNDHEDVHDSAASNCNNLKTYLEELSQCIDDKSKKDLLVKITSVVQSCPSDVIMTHFKPLLTKIISYISDNESSSIKEVTLHLLQNVVKRKAVIILLKQFSDLVITRVISVCSDSSKDVAKAAEQCAVLLSTHLPAESVVRVIVPLITSESISVKLIAIKMLTQLVENTNDSIIRENIDQVMPVLLEACNSTELPVRKAAVFCMVALHKQSEEMKECLEPYKAKLDPVKLKLLNLYIDKAHGNK